MPNEPLVTDNLPAFFVKLEATTERILHELELMREHHQNLEGRVRRVEVTETTQSRILHDVEQQRGQVRSLEERLRQTEQDAIRLSTRLTILASVVGVVATAIGTAIGAAIVRVMQAAP